MLYRLSILFIHIFSLFKIIKIIRFNRHCARSVIGELDNLNEGSFDDVNWPKGIAYLTEQGIKQCKHKGAKFAKKLISDYGIFTDKINFAEIEIMTTDKQRVKDSAFIFIKSFAKFSTIEQDQIENRIKIVNKKSSQFLGDNIKYNCPAFGEYKKLNKKFQSSEIKVLEKSFQTCLSNSKYQLEHSDKLEQNIQTCDRIQDDMLVYKQHDKFHNKQPIECFEVQEKCHNLFWSGIKYGPRAAELAASPSMDKIKSALQDKRHKVHLFFTNDNTIHPIATLFGVNLSGSKVRFADDLSIIIMERSDKVKFVKIIQQNRNISILRYEQFRQLIDKNEQHYKNVCSNFKITEQPYLLSRKE